MKKNMPLLGKTALATPVLALLVVTPLAVAAATSPGLGMAATFGILSSTYTNTAGGTTINGDLGYTTAPAVGPTVNGTTHHADGTYRQAGSDQGAALSALNRQPCSFSFAPGAVDLTLDTSHGQVGVFAPGVYCITGAASIGGGRTITLTGSGTYIFRSTGALDTSANSVVASNGASACDVWWTPGGATTLGANSTFVGTDVDAPGITVGNVATWTGRALAYGGTVTTSRDTITVPTCAAAPTPTPRPTPTPSGAPTPTPRPPVGATPVPAVPPAGLGSTGNGFPWAPAALILLGLSTLRIARRKT